MQDSSASKAIKDLTQTAKERFATLNGVEDLDECGLDEDGPVFVSREELLKLNISEEELSKLLGN